MSDAASPIRTAEPLVDAADGGTLSAEAIEVILADFRAWLHNLAAVPTPTDEPSAVDLFMLVSQFTALRHEINLQTKSARSALEQNGEALAELRGAVEELRERPTMEDDLTPLLKAIVDVYDNLALALRQVMKQREAIEQPLAGLTDGVGLPEPLAKEMARLRAARAPSFWSRLFGVPTLRSQELDGFFQLVQTRRDRMEQAAKLIRSSFDGLIAGYQMSLNRVDRVLEQFNLETIPAVGATFDPELMEAVEVVGDSGRPAGEVVEEVRRGYMRGEIVFRYAQVKVAR
jgi:molecular chaperone GrpE